MFRSGWHVHCYKTVEDGLPRPFRILQTWSRLSSLYIAHYVSSIWIGVLLPVVVLKFQVWFLCMQSGAWWSAESCLGTIPIITASCFSMRYLGSKSVACLRHVSFTNIKCNYIMSFHSKRPGRIMFSTACESPSLKNDGTLLTLLSIISLSETVYIYRWRIRRDLKNAISNWVKGGEGSAETEYFIPQRCEYIPLHYRPPKELGSCYKDLMRLIIAALSTTVSCVKNSISQARP